MWKSPVHKIKKSIVTQEYGKGGLNMINIENFIASMKISWIKSKLLNSSAKWQSVIGEDININQVIKYGPTFALKYIEDSKNRFWQDVFSSWKRLENCFENALTVDKMGKSVLWFNEKLKVDKKPMHLKEWCKNNIYLVNSLLDEEGNIMTYEQFKNIYAIRTNFLEFLGVTQAVKILILIIQLRNKNQLFLYTFYH